MSEQAAIKQPEKQKPAKTEVFFMYINIALVGMLLYCIPGFLSFRKLARENGFYFVSDSSWIWCLTGLVLFGTIKYAYFSLIRQKMLSIINPKYKGEERLYRLKNACKLSFDTIFYTVSSLTGYYLFRNQPWFPKMAGGDGSCEMIYRQYPDWPSQSISPALERFYMMQLGVHAFAIVESIIIKRKTDRKYHQFLLHHFIATTLILFSMLCNMVAVGAVILVIHDFSDVTAAFSRGFVETKYDNIITDAFLFVITAVNWFYMRSVVFPFCIIRQIYESLPSPLHSWWEIRTQHSYLLLLCTILACMHLFWFFFLIQYAVERALGKGRYNTHDKPKQL